MGKAEDITSHSLLTNGFVGMLFSSGTTKQVGCPKKVGLPMDCGVKRVQTVLNLKKQNPVHVNIHLLKELFPLLPLVTW